MTVSPKDADNRPRLRIFRRHGYSMSSIAAKSSEVCFRFSHLTLLSIKNYEYFCAQNYELSYGYFIVTPIMGLGEVYFPGLA